ncbi:DUF2623 family protein [Paraburkholderia heleia]|uniref:DUF2623 family protein n=1 Tax=Paraburkholderia heleia TaxID=634127 RepID=UPI0031D844F8
MTRIPQAPPPIVELGFAAGADAPEAPDKTEMSKFKEAYALGFVAGFGTTESVRCMSRMAAATTAGTLASRYGLPVDDVLRVLALPPGIRRRAKPCACAEVRSPSWAFKCQTTRRFTAWLCLHGARPTTGRKNWWAAEVFFRLVSGPA